MPRTPVIALLLLAAATCTWGQGATDIQTVRLQDGLYLLKGTVGNVVLSVGAEGAVLVDDEYAVGTSELVAAIAAVTAQPVPLRHQHPLPRRPYAGNDILGCAGAIIIAQENACRRMSTDQVMSLFGPQPAYAPIGQPRITFDQSLQLHLNGNSIELIYPGPSHTDGDAIVIFHERNALMTGDLFVRAPLHPALLRRSQRRAGIDGMSHRRRSGAGTGR